ncbi:AGC PKA kinase protein [Rutstroemia sp. NJR-2017a WRK4]|nr:AGC PKA kinase protein [Rutstroemia sp. NJR-2017a WRK4]
MSDPLSITASIVALLQLTKSVVEYVKDVKGGQMTGDNIWSTISLLEMLKFRFEDATVDGVKLSSEIKMDVKAPLRELQRVLEKLVGKLAPASKAQRAMQNLAWPFTKGEVKDLLSSIERQKSHLTLAMENNHMRLSQSIKDDVNELRLDHKRHEEHLRDKEAKEAIEWISAVDFGGKQSNVESARVPGTSEWILQHPFFDEWLNGSRRTLWCPGIPGAGKTVIAYVPYHRRPLVMNVSDRTRSVIISHLLGLQRLRQDGGLGVAFIYCNYKEQDEQTIPNLMSSILHQLTVGAPEIAKDVMRRLIENHQKQIRPSMVDALDTLRAIVSTYQTAYVVIDALDECSEGNGERSELIGYLRKMPSNLKILCTSRELPDIEKLFAESGKVYIYARETDVEKYLEGQIEKSTRLRNHVRADPTLQQHIVKTIVDRVDGMFLLAQLHIEILSKKLDRRSIRRALASLPTTLDATYDEALKRIRTQDQDEVELAEQVLYWISFASRPLTVTELRCAVAVGRLDPDEKCMDDEAFVDKEILVDVCAGIVTTDLESDTSIIRLVHYTTQQYFERNRATIFPDAQTQISRACYTIFISRRVLTRTRIRKPPF